MERETGVSKVIQKIRLIEPIGMCHIPMAASNVTGKHAPLVPGWCGGFLIEKLCARGVHCMSYGFPLSKNSAL